MVKIFRTERIELHRALFQTKALLMRILSDLRGHVIADDWVQASDEHKTGVFVSSGRGSCAALTIPLVQQRRDSLLVSLDSFNKVSLKASH